ncbi:MAG TPA: PepSY-associated TM helix domain-containing protein [Vicinamibacterales bacterium]|jgi:uncharacterized iron-regulated membrane protein
MQYWQQWVAQPQQLWLRRAIFQIHLWSGVGVGLYVLLISVTGSILVFRNELYTAATRPPVHVTAAGSRLSDETLSAAAARAHPGFSVVRIGRTRTADQAVAIELKRGGETISRLFDPYTGKDLGNSVPLGIWLVSRLIVLHDDLLAGRTGRTVNGAGALLLVVMALTGMVVWWPGKRSWRRSLTVHRGVGWRRFTWDLHGAVGFWTVVVILMFALSGAYLGLPQPFENLADWLEPPTEANAGSRLVDQILYWLAYLHFGRINGIGIPCGGPGACDIATKTVWAAIGLIPGVMFVTGAVMWWNRVLVKRLRSQRLTKDTESEGRSGVRL